MPNSTLTREDILAMPAGAGMDALVARRVMGWAKMTILGTGSDHDWWGPVSENQTVGPMRVRTSLWRPSRQSETMMEVINALIARSQYPTIQYAVGQWLVMLRPSFVYAFADTLSLAVCRAALLTTVDDA